MQNEEVNLQPIFENNTYSSYFELGLIDISNQILLENLKGNSFLELGCGIGTTTKLLFEKSRRYICVEHNHQYIDSTKKITGNSEKVNFVNSSWEDFETESEFSDIIFFRGLDCVDDLDIIFYKLQKLSKNDSVIHIVVTNGTSFHRVLAEKLSINKVNSLTEHANNVGRKQVLNYEIMADYLEKHNFEILLFEGIGFKMFPNEEMDKLAKDKRDAFLKLGNVNPKMAVELYFKIRCK